MELEHFPFDRQLLQFTITASVPVSMLKLEVGWGNVADAD